MSRDKVLFEKSKVRQRGGKGGRAADKVRVWGRSKAGNGNHPQARASHFRKREKKQGALVWKGGGSIPGRRKA